MKRIIGYFSKGEMLLWGCSAGLIVLSFCLFDGSNLMILFASLVGVTSILINAKGNPLGQGLMILFSLLYAIVSYSFSYFGEMITYLGMTMPMAVVSVVSWLRNPYKGNRAEVKVGGFGKHEIVWMFVTAAFVTGIFYFILRYFHTANLLPSTVSVTTSFIAAWLTFRRNPYFSIAYAANDLILIILWTLASVTDLRYIPVAVCFGAFLANDIYGFVSWQKMKKRQSE